jgi:hypothetical protein
VVNNVQNANAGSYSVRITNGCGTALSNAATLTINATTAINTQPASQTVCAGQRVRFDVSASGSGTLTYQWSFNGNPIASATADSLVIASTTASNAGNYTVTVTGTCGVVTSSPAVLTVNTGGACAGSAVSAVSEEVSASVLMPNTVRHSTKLRVTVRRAMTIAWTISDAQGRVVKRFTQPVNAGANDVQVSVVEMAPGTYQLTGYPSRGGMVNLRFVKL